jgi:hypothetical protein
MRRLIALSTLLFSLACGEDTLAPVQTVDGSWSGVQNGYSLSLSLAQATTGEVTGTAFVASTAVATDATVVGTFAYPTLHITISANGFTPVDYVGDMSATEAKIFGHLNGSGFSNVQMDVKKK